jgi:hypothetical protein
MGGAKAQGASSQTLGMNRGPAFAGETDVRLLDARHQPIFNS